MDLGSEAGGEPGGVEEVDGAGTAAPGEEAVIVRAHVVAEHRHHAHPRDHHPLLRVRLPPRCPPRGRGCVREGTSDVAAATAMTSGRTRVCMAAAVGRFWVHARPSGIR